MHQGWVVVMVMVGRFVFSAQLWMRGVLSVSWQATIDDL